MKDIELIYTNSLGIAFRWKSNSSKTINKVQFIFRDTGLLLSQISFAVSYDEVLALKDLVDATLFQWNLTAYLAKNGLSGNHN